MSLTERIGSFLARTNLGVDRWIEAALIAGSEDRPIEMPLLAVCGAPRTGSTLTYQIIAHAFDVLYVSNFQNVLHRVPMLGTRLLGWISSRYVSDFRSEGGFVPGLNGPAESMRFWSYWCDHDLTEKTPSVAADRRVRFRRTMNSLYALKHQPLLGGYLPHSLYLDDLQSLFPRLLVIRTNRDLLDSAISGLKRWRATMPKDPAAMNGFFFGTRPQEVLGEMSMHEYVARQQYFTSLRMDAFERNHPDRVLHAPYEPICADPRQFVEGLAERCSRLGIELRRRTDTSLPAQFSESSYKGRIDDDARKIAAELDRLHQVHGPTLTPYRRPSPSA